MNAALDKAIPILIEPLVRTGIYGSQEEALKNLVLRYVQEQIDDAEQQIARFQKKYGMGFEEWSDSLVGKATIEEEDDWIEWESARDMLESWQRIKADIEQIDVSTNPANTP
jgi:Arc/MetJ-type ribon-helix-helix transcriptional regulator